MRNGVHVKCPRHPIVNVTLTGGRVVKVVCTDKAEATKVRALAHALTGFVVGTETFTPRLTKRVTAR